MYEKSYKKLNNQRTIYPSDKVLLKALSLSRFEVAKKMELTIKKLGKSI